MDDSEAKERTFVSWLVSAYGEDLDYFQHVLDVLGSYKGDCPQILNSMGTTLFQQNPALLEQFFILFPWAQPKENSSPIKVADTMKTAICPNCSSPFSSNNLCTECISSLDSINVQVPGLPDIQKDVVPAAAVGAPAEVQLPTREKWSFSPPSVSQRRTEDKQEVKASSSLVPKHGVSEMPRQRAIIQKREWRKEAIGEPLKSVNYGKKEEEERGQEMEEEEMPSRGRNESEGRQPSVNGENKKLETGLAKEEIMGEREKNQAASLSGLSAPSVIKLTVSGLDGNQILFRIKKTTKMDKLMRSYSNRIGVPIAPLRFLFDGRRINYNETAIDVGMVDGDVIHVFLEQPVPDPGWMHRYPFATRMRFHNFDVGAAGHPPLDSSTIQKISSVLISHDQAAAKLSCSVCLEYFNVGEEVKKLECGHMFHTPCIWRWLKLHGTCPVCRQVLGSVAAK